MNESEVVTPNLIMNESLESAIACLLLIYPMANRGDLEALQFVPRWVAVDLDGELWVYRAKPHLHIGSEADQDSATVWVFRSGVDNAEQSQIGSLSTSNSHKYPDWQDSLLELPDFNQEQL